MSFRFSRVAVRLPRGDEQVSHVGAKRRGGLAGTASWLRVHEFDAASLRGTPDRSYLVCLDLLPVARHALCDTCPDLAR